MRASLKASCLIVGAALLGIGTIGSSSALAHEKVQEKAHEKTQEDAFVTEVTPNVLVFATKGGNVAASVGPDGAVLVGTPSADSTASINKLLAGRTNSPVRYVVIGSEDPERSEGDAGWGRLGAFVGMQENALRRLGGNKMGAPTPVAERFMKLGVDRPRIAFSEVLAMDVNGEAIHIVRQKPGHDDADTLTHFHVAKLVYFGEVFPGDGYPVIDSANGGTLDGILETLGGWTSPAFHIVPARGPMTTGARVKEFRDMLGTVRDRIKKLVGAGQSEEQVIQAHPTADFDSTWGHGRTSAEEFVRAVYRSLQPKKSK